ncbi:MAG: hypothetical protein PHT44_02210 [Candidatus Portnoybacteria bacterium]|nr:hypothetical protein [Candidatus Portnoybacteria bacterium]MDD4982354.1 hypothetical protein [Candidatus Portnoybacteria bacterium]
MDCGDPEKSMLVCQCGRRADVARLDTRKEKFFLQNFFKGIDPEIWSLPDVRQKGITILVPVCGKCVGGKEDGPLEKTEVYRIRDPF